MTRSVLKWPKAEVDPFRRYEPEAVECIRFPNRPPKREPVLDNLGSETPEPELASGDTLVIALLCQKLQLRQHAIATATAVFRRFYLKNSLRSTDPVLLISVCLYVAARAGELLVHIKNVTVMSKSMFTQHYGPHPICRSLPHLHPPPHRNGPKPKIEARINPNHAALRVASSKHANHQTSRGEQQQGETAECARFPDDERTRRYTHRIHPPAQSLVPVEVTIEPGKTAITNTFLSQVLAGMRGPTCRIWVRQRRERCWGCQLRCCKGVGRACIIRAWGWFQDSGGMLGQQQQYAVDNMLERTMDAYVRRRRSTDQETGLVARSQPKVKREKGTSTDVNLCLSDGRLSDSLEYDKGGISFTRTKVY
ncbi:hypothetical protein BKA70DRAFT_1242192 [Coprinopsis sp. MPI-PUGE-AT-0042]|nr:hypothetical protein BKA70DRAFT_1242192 [Coprinopsis sp. MPI-PUGE-AT-0042]